MKPWVLISVTTVILAVAILGLATQWSADSFPSFELMVVKEIQTVGRAETQYLFRSGRYAATLAELGLPVSKDGYLFTLTLTSKGYAINARPRIFGSTGRRTFYLDQNGTVHQNWGPDPATANSPEFK